MINLRGEDIKAAILVAQNEPLVFDTINPPEKLEVGQVLVKVIVSGICGSQIGEIKGVKGKDRFLPHLMGHEGCGIVLEIGPGVRYVKPNDKVVLHWRKGIGIESETPKYVWKDKPLNAGWVTTFNSHSIVSENRCTKVPNDTDPELAALFGCAITTGFGVIENNAQVRLGESVVVFGAGGVGLNIIQAASLVSAYPIIAVDRFDSRLSLAKEFGAHYVVNSVKSDSSKIIKEIIGENNLDVFIDNTGIPEIIEFGYELTHSKGRVILVGVPRKGSDIKIHTLPLHYGKVITGSHGGECFPSDDIPRILRLLNISEIDMKKLYSKSFKLKDINLAIDAMQNPLNAGRILIEP